MPTEEAEGLRNPTEDAVNVFQFILDPRVGGPHVYVRTLAEGLPPIFHITVVTAGTGPMTDWSLVNWRHTASTLYPFEVVVNVLMIIWRFRSAVRRTGVVFDVHGAANLAPLIAARLLRIPVVWHFHETVLAFARLAQIGRRFLRGAPHCKVGVAWAAKQAFGLTDAVVIAGGVDTSFWSPAPAAEPASGSPDEFRLVAVGNLNPLKGIDVLIDAIVSLEGRWRLDIVGAELATFAGYATILREKAARIGSGGRIGFLGWQSPAEVLGLLRGAHIFLLPSRSEACPLALLEAMAVACLCIATDVGDVRQILDNGARGLVVPADQPAALRQALQDVMAMPVDERRAMGMRARQGVEALYAKEQLARRHAAIYAALASGPLQEELR